MKSLVRRFQVEQDKSPLISTLVNFGRAVEHQNFSELIIKRWFSKLVDVDDYDQKDKKAVIAHMVKLSNSPKPREALQKST